MCREELPPRPEQLFEEGIRLLSTLRSRVDWGETSWNSPTQQRTMDVVEQKWRLAAEQGHVHAQNCLGFMCAHGEGVAQNYKEAMRWFMKAAENGHAKARYNLGNMHARGHGGSKLQGGDAVVQERCGATACRGAV